MKKEFKVSSERATNQNAVKSSSATVTHYLHTEKA